MATIALLYGIGVAVGVLFIDARPLARVGLALMWPLGFAACVVTIAGLAVIAAIAFPLVGVVLAALAGAAWLWSSAG